MCVCLSPKLACPFDVEVCCFLLSLLHILPTVLFLCILPVSPLSTDGVFISKKKKLCCVIWFGKSIKKPMPIGMWTCMFL